VFRFTGAVAVVCGAADVLREFAVCAAAVATLSPRASIITITMRVMSRLQSAPGRRGVIAAWERAGS